MPWGGSIGGVAYAGFLFFPFFFGFPLLPLDRSGGGVKLGSGMTSFNAHPLST